MGKANEKNGLLVILSGPSGSGKDTLLESLVQIDGRVRVSVSLTTRTKREWETDGIHYYFVTDGYFQRKLEEGMILEHAQYGNAFYGTPKAPVDDLLQEGKTVILKIEVQGAAKIRALYPDAVSIFLMPPSLSILEERLRNRETEDEEDIQRRLMIAANEFNCAAQYDYLVVNHTVECATADIAAILRAERLRTSRAKYRISEVTQHVES